MQKCLLFYISILILIILYGCKKEKKCAGFDENDLMEFTYKTSDTLVFHNEDSLLFKVYINEINKSLPYSFECKDLYKTCACINYVEAKATDSNTSESYTFLKMEQSDVSEMQYFNYNVRGFKFEFDFINELPYINQMQHLQHLSSFSIGDEIFNDVIIVTNMNLSSAIISQVYFNKENGVLRFIEKSTNMVWSIKN
jgi:hypothetical protein